MVRQNHEAAKMCLHQHGVRPRSMDIARQRHRLELNQGQRKVMRPLSSHHRLPKSSRGVTGHPKSLWGPNGDYCSGINDIDVAGNRSLMILYASIFFCFAMFSAWHRLKNTRNWNSLTCPMKTCHSSNCSNNNTSNTNSNNNINSSSKKQQPEQQSHQTQIQKWRRRNNLKKIKATSNS